MGFAGSDGTTVSQRLYVTVKKLPHVRRLVLIAWGVVDARIDLELNRARISVSGGDATELLLDCHIAPKRVRWTPSPSHLLNATCPITLDMKRDDDLDLPSAAELLSRQDLLCRSCGVTMVDLSGIRKVLPLPSEHWMDMSELWVCDPHTMSAIAEPYGLPNHRLDQAAIDGVALVGIREVIVPDSAVRAPLQCKCGCILGEPVAGGVCLWKRAIRVADEPLFTYYTTETDAVASVLQYCHSQSRYMIELTNPADDRHIYMQICNWDLFVIQAVYTVAKDGCLHLETRLPRNGKRFAPVIEVLFAIKERQPSSLPASFASARQFEQMQLALEQFDAIAARLSASHAMLPPSQREMGDMSMGILPRLSRIL